LSGKKKPGKNAQETDRKMLRKTFVVRCPRCGRLNRVHEEHVRLERCPYCQEEFVRRMQKAGAAAKKSGRKKTARRPP